MGSLTGHALRRAMQLPRQAPPPVDRMIYRVVSAGLPRGTWRTSHDAAMKDAKLAQLASWDGERREWYLAVPVSIQRRKIVDRPG